MRPKLFLWPGWKNEGIRNMLITAVEPDLLIYKEEDWRSQQQHCFIRLQSLMLHRAMIRKSGQPIAITDDYAGAVYQHFPYNTSARSVKELQDLRVFIFDDLTKAHRLDVSGNSNVRVQADDKVCNYVDDADVLDAWNTLVWGCVREEIESNHQAQVATWKEPAETQGNPSITVEIKSDEGLQVYVVPLVWDSISWNKRLALVDAWPDLRMCVERLFHSDIGLRDHPKVRRNPIPFECTESFWKSIDTYCEANMRPALIRAITKKVYGIWDASLGDESVGRFRRFRVTSFWRVHYRDKGDRIILDQFGEHDMDL